MTTNAPHSGRTETQSGATDTMDTDYDTEAPQTPMAHTPDLGEGPAFDDDRRTDGKVANDGPSTDPD